MESRRRLYLFIALFLTLTLFLVACERPIDDEETTTSEESADTGTGTETAVEETSEVSEETAVEEEATGAAEESETPTEESDTPRVEVEEATPEPTPSEDSASPGESGAAAAETSEDKTKESGEEAAPAETAEAATAEVETSQAVEAALPTTHTVAAGENLYRIGLKYNVSWVTLAQLNGLSNANRITVGQVLKIPGAESSGEPEPTPSPATETMYTVKAGDNLYKIGLLYGITWVQIAEANGLVNPNQILVGQVLKIPVDTPGPTPQFTHLVKAGETLFLISLQYGVSWPVIAEVNNLSSPYVIFAGQTLVIPGG